KSLTEIHNLLIQQSKIKRDSLRRMCPWGYALFFADETEVHSFNDVSTLPENFKIDWSQVKAHLGSNNVQFKVASLYFEGDFEGSIEKAFMGFDAVVSTPAESTEMAVSIFTVYVATP